MPARKKTFPCGHKGRGQYCHYCAQEQQEKTKKREQELEEKRVWKDSFDQDPIDLTFLPSKTLVRKARTILERIAQGAPYTDFRGKRLNHDRTIISLPLTPDYRLLFQDTGSGLQPLECLSHEAYNVKKPGT